MQKDCPVTEGAIMTNKLFIGIIPLLTACTIDLEMQLDVGLKDKNEDIEALEEMLMEEGADLLDMGDAESDADETVDETSIIVEDTSSASCEVAIFAPFVSTAGEEIVVEWEISGEPQAETVIALLQEQDVLHIDFLPMDEMIYSISAPEEVGEYSIYVASGADLQHPDCFTIHTFTVDETVAETDPDLNPEGDAQNISCEDVGGVQMLPEVEVGDVALIPWDVELFADEVEVLMYTQSEENPEMIFMDVTQNVGVYELFISNDMEAGRYGLSLVSPSLDTCLHYELTIENNFLF